MVIHAHHCQNPISGEMKRVINIDIDVVGILSNEVIEIEFYSFRAYKYVSKEGRFTLSPKIVRKYCIPRIAHLGIWDNFYRSIIVAYLCIKYKPTHYIEEWTLPVGLKTLRKLFFKTTQLILDIHGAAPEEALYSTGVVNHSLENSEKNSVKIADKIVCQSDEMKRHLVRKHNCTESNICVFRCGVDTNIFKYKEHDRLRIRKELQVADNELLFVYSGGMHKWQKVETALKYFMTYHNMYVNSKILVLTKDNEGLNRIVENEKLANIIPHLIVKSLPYNEVSSYLSASDVSFLIRDNVVMNAVASPTKLAEYMACGLPVISTSVAEKWVTLEGMNYIIDVENTAPEDLHSIMMTVDKNVISSYSQNTLSLSIDRKSAKDFFQTV